MSHANFVPLSPISFLNRAADVYRDSMAVLRPDGTGFNYSQLRHRASQLAQAVGRTESPRVAFLAPNDVPMLEAHFGVPAAGCVLVPLNTRLAPGEYAFILRHSGVRTLIVDHELADRIDGIREAVPDLEHIIEITPGNTRVGDIAYEEWTSSFDGDVPLSLPQSETDPISINYTSGTTGEPKGAQYTHRGAYLNAMGQALEFGLTPDSVYLWTLPMFHCNGWCFTWAVTALGATHVVMRDFDPDLALDAIAAHGVTHFCGAPVVLNAMAHAPTSAARNFPDRVTVATGGAPPSPTVISRMQTLGMDVVHLYGLTETYGPSLVCERQLRWSTVSADERAALMARQGVRTINVESVRVVDEELAEVTADGETLGEIVVRSNTVMDKYIDDPLATDAAFRGGWLHTGDLAVVHRDGYIEVRDRAKDIIISGGENISSIEVENAIASHPDVIEVAVVSQPDETWGEVPAAFVTRRSGSHTNADEIVTWVRDRLAHFKAPKQVYFRDLPKTSTGKIRKTELREFIRSSSSGPAS